MNNDILEIGIEEVQLEKYTSTNEEQWETMKEEFGERLFGELEYD